MPILHLRAGRDRLVRTALSTHAPAGGLFDEVVIDGPRFLLPARAKACRQAIRQWADDRGQCG
ncbi:MAG: hypothetical protein KF903_10820 [Dokdonella sp.]|uniref:hypothetical protein n=1 Tax=Dokdonella sp. TaxID=2291710 RepID=UPI0025BEA99E|nr:hypothetical protein [Dokdonella sp.]MBX3701474.1 hypothetical protein [Dokdonella sp.]MCW5577177.1 hypothetical protein [Dokdonella sp.]